VIYCDTPPSQVVLFTETFNMIVSLSLTCHFKKQNILLSLET